MTHPDHPDNPLGRLIAGPWFQNTILALIVIAAVLVGIETYPAIMDRHGHLLHTLDKVVLWLFTLEAVLKMAQHGRRFYRYFLDPWNIFDFVIVAVCFLPVDSQYAAVLRLARIMRALRLITAIPRLQLIVGSLIKALPSMVYVSILLGLMFYVYAVMGVFLWGGNDPVHFGNLQKSMLSLFRVVTLEDWTDVMYIQMWGSDRYPFNEGDRATFAGQFHSRASPVLGAAYFVSFVLLGTMIMLNLFIGVIINSMEEAQDEQAADARERSMEKTGHLSVSDEIALIEKQLEELQQQLRLIRTRGEAEH
ncbi:MAG: ion transporter [Phycisphaerales bacterium JB063]